MSEGKVRPQKETKAKASYVQIENNFAKALRKMAIKNHRTFKGEVNAIIESYINNLPMVSPQNNIEGERPQ